MVESGANVNVKNNYGDTALRHAVMVRKLEFVIYLISVEADVNLQNNAGNNPLYYAAENGDLDIVKTLEAHGS